MKRCVFACCFFLSSLFAVAQTSFPKDFIGHWEGTLTWYRAGKAEPQQVKMQLLIKPTDSANTYTWQIIYGEKGEDNRPYILKPVDTTKGHWQIDERNGIVLDQYFIGNRFTCAFTVQTTTIVNSYWREGENLVAEFHGLTAKPVATTGLGTEESPKVESYGTKSYQRAVMRKMGKVSAAKGLGLCEGREFVVRQPEQMLIKDKCSLIGLKLIRKRSANSFCRLANSC